ncbi:hypothetical protein [Treponema sp. R6D11]
MRTRSRIASENRDFKARKATLVSADIPVIGLKNKSPASASEILAGVLNSQCCQSWNGLSGWGKYLRQGSGSTGLSFKRNRF